MATSRLHGSRVFKEEPKNGIGNAKHIVMKAGAKVGGRVPLAQECPNRQNIAVGGFKEPLKKLVKPLTRSDTTTDLKKEEPKNGIGNAKHIVMKAGAKVGGRVPLAQECPNRQNIAVGGSKEPLKELVKPLTRSDTTTDLKVSFSRLRFVEDIDAEDMSNPQLVAAYVTDIYDYLHELEDKCPLRRNFLLGRFVTERHRNILIDWLILVHSRMSFLQETLYLTVAILDRYLQFDHTLKKNKLQLVGATCLHIAAKYEEMYIPSILDFVHLSEESFQPDDMKQMEIKILKALQFHLGHPLPIHFLRRDSKAAEVDSSQHGLAKYFLELCVMDYSLAPIKSSRIAAASLCLALILSEDKTDCEGQKLLWHPTVEHYSRYKYEDLVPIIKKIAALAIQAKNKRNTLYMKYASSKYQRVSQSPQLDGDILKELANRESE